ncbi:uncharacterized protein DDB_G0271670-like isoform X1 [Frankliniella occidentalis]|uniref:Uncharacterized protein DDB_G0271670-like isoform X1 n=1 Tax=Frankliniella occidentalis TaxID=133901 RepID=A0A6J1TF81_FRAOC|nr:uncharacterized protein DDB_G0271670-like isoform X1 [Frankliniella occidentalis]
MSDKSKSKKKYHCVSAEDGFYCVPTRDIRSADPSNIKVGDAVMFHYGSHVKNGEVLFISSKESETLEEMKRRRRENRTVKEESFHAEKPRKSALKQRAMMKELQSSGKVSEVVVKLEEPSGSKPASKKAKKAMKERAQLLAESEMLLGSDPPVKPLVNESDQSTLSSSITSDSSSSIDPKLKVSKAGDTSDVKSLKALQGPDSDSDKSSVKAGNDLHEEGHEQFGNDTRGALNQIGAVDMNQDGPSPALNGGDSLTEDLKIERTPTLPINPDGDEVSANTAQSSDKTIPDSSAVQLEAPDDKTVGTSHKKHRSRSCSSTSSSSSSSSDSSSSSSSDDRRKKRKHRKKKSKKAKKSRRKKQKKSSKYDSSEDESSDEKKKYKKRSRRLDSSDSEEVIKEKRKKKRKHKKSSSSDSSDDESKRRMKSVKQDKRFKNSKREYVEPSKSYRVKRNLNLFPGQMYLHSAETPGAVKVHDKYEVYIPESTLNQIIKDARSLPLLVKHLVQNVFTKEALHGSTAQGYPNRVLGRHYLRQSEVLPRLDPNGREAIMQRALSVQEDKKAWRPRARLSNVSQHFSQAVGDEKAPESSGDDSSSDSS